MIPKSHFNLLLALSLFFLSFLAYIYVTQQYQIQLLQYQLLKLQSPTPILSPTPIPTSSSATSTWQTYENKIHGFSFKYPSNYISTYEDDRKMTSSYLTTIHSSDYGVNKEELAYTYGTAFYYVDIKNNQCSEIKNLVSSTPTFKLINTDGLKNTIIFEIYDKLSSNFPSRGALVSINNKCVEMYCNSTKQGCTDNELGKEFIQILSTFKFTN